MQTNGVVRLFIYKYFKVWRNIETTI